MLLPPRPPPPSSLYQTELMPRLLTSARAIDEVGVASSAHAKSGEVVAGGSVLADQIAPEGGESQWEREWRAAGGLVPFMTSAPSSAVAAAELDEFTKIAGASSAPQ